MSVWRRRLRRRLCLRRLGPSGGSFVLSWLGVLVDLDSTLPVGLAFLLVIWFGCGNAVMYKVQYTKDYLGT